MNPEEHKQLYAAASNWCSRDGSAASGKQCGYELLFWLDAHPPVAAVPCTEIVAWFKAGEVASELVKLLKKHSPEPTPPNPHPQGSYLWAREEHMRGRNVQLLAVDGGRDGFCVRPSFDWDANGWRHHEVVATDWVVP